MTIRAAAAAVCASLLLVGCSADADDPEPLPPVESASPSAVALPLPSEAAAEDAFGASAFVRYFFAQVNSSYSSLDAAPVRALSASDCNSCKNIIDDIERLESSGLSVAGNRFTLDYAEAPPPDGDGSVIVDFRFDSDPYVERSRDGQVSRNNPAKKDQMGQAKLIRRQGEWLMQGLRLLEGDN